MSARHPLEQFAQLGQWLLAYGIIIPYCVQLLQGLLRIAVYFLVDCLRYLLLIVQSFHRSELFVLILKEKGFFQ